MHHRTLIIITLILSLISGLKLSAQDGIATGSGELSKYNILFLISDDMNDWIGCLDGHPDAITPNLDRLAERGILFEQAHCSAPICNPSRASVMSGLNPSSTGCYGNRQALRMSPVGFDAVTLPRYFSENGYFSSGVGKITHGKFPDPASWDDFFPNLRSQSMEGAEPTEANINGLNNPSFDWGPLDVADSAMKDGKITRHTIDMLAKDYDKPFFLACGWKLPHLTWFAPRKYFEMYDPQTITMPLIREDDLNDLPPKALRYTENSYYKSVTEGGKEREGVQAYLACISYIDAQVGLVLDALDSSKYADNTIIVFWGDHGWHLGEKRHWSKSTLWEESTRAPLMIAGPGIKPGRCSTPVSFLDIYPTLIDLTGLAPKTDLDGQSLLPLMKDTDTEWDRPALTTHGKGNHSLRSKRWRYTIYSDGGEELYDHAVDEMEFNNLADDPAYSDVKAGLRKWLPESDADDVYVLDWPREEKIFWEATLKAAERYHGKSVYPEDYSALAKDAELSLEKGIAFMKSLAIEGGYVYHYSMDGKEKWGEGKTDDRTIEVQPPGTPAVGMSFLRAYRITGNKDFLNAAEDAASALCRGQNEMGGWDHKIYFDRPKGKTVSFDDNQTQSTISFLMDLDREIDRPYLSQTLEKALDMMLKSQLDNGGWPHKYPWQGNYHDYATFNDHGINDCIRVMIEADSYYQEDKYAESLEKVARFLMISQLPPPQPGWAQQYNEYNQPAWARTFEPPAVCPSATLNNINSLIDMYLHTGRDELLEPIPDAIRWVKESRLPNGKWGRFLELGTNKALYYDRGRIRVNSIEELSLERRTGYGYEVDLEEALKTVELRFKQVREKDPALSITKNETGIEALSERVRDIVQDQDELGRWIVHQDQFRKEVPGKRWNGEYRIEDRISSELFNFNIAVLCDFLEAYKAL